MNTLVMVMLTLLAAATGPSATPGVKSTAITPPSDKPAWTRYSVVVERSMFAKKRPPIRTEHDPAPKPEVKVDDAAPPPPPPPAKPGSHHVLVGISVVGERAYAFIENQRDHQVARVKVGETVDGLTVRDITIDGIVRADGDNKLDIPVGYLLSGEQPPAPLASSSTSSSSGRAMASTASTDAGKPGATAGDASKPAGAADAGTSPAAGAAGGAGDDANLSILERLRRRREQELNK
ncbi:MAG: hypothetical protein GC162_01225 [Planctomycetes bacterium]|nr:hypothetical protein [Planctomycetota bacterium]